MQRPTARYGVAGGVIDLQRSRAPHGFIEGAMLQRRRESMEGTRAAQTGTQGKRWQIRLGIKSQRSTRGAHLAARSATDG
jgi:hypothetical protein